MRKPFWLIGVAACLALPAWAQQRDFSKVEIKPTHVAGNVYMLEGSGGNIGVSAGKDGVLIVDDQYAPLADKIKAAIKGINPGPLKLVLNTHWHGDHTGGNEIFGAEAPIVAQTNVRKRMSTDQTVFGDVIKASPPGALPVLTYDQSVSVHFNGEEIKVIHFPHGHTDGDSIIFFTGANVVHMGDDFFAGRFPFVDLGSGGSVQGLIDATAKVLAEIADDAKVIPGHGPLGGKAELKAFHDMLVETSNVVRQAMKKGKSSEAIQAAGLPDKWKEWGSGFIDAKKWLGTIYDSYKAGAPKKTAAPKAKKS
jgi:glyoxylase-like metal-dependent hydrolase (beta-lactamase superfamily II)